ncbi:MAG: hypothetical protein ACT4PT_11720, partial [Methanobacteriota archaeon]
TLRLPPGSQDTVSVPWNTTGLAGPYLVTVAIETAAGEPDVDPRNDRSVQAFVRTTGLTLSAPPSQDGRPGQAVSYEASPYLFLLRNTGNRPEFVSIEVRSEHAWVRHEESFLLSPGDPVPIRVNVPIPARPGTLSDTLRATARLSNLTSVSVANATVTRVIDEVAPTIHEFAPPAEVEVGASTRIVAVVDDAVGVARVELRVGLPSGATALVPLAPETGSRDATNLTLTELGPHTLVLRAVDVASPNNTATTEAAPKTVLARYLRAPRIELSGVSDGAHLNGTEPLRFNVTDDVPLVDVTADLDGLLLPLQAPYRLPTASWSEGPHVLTLTARNVFGTEARATWNLTVDRTPPGVRNVVVVPSSPPADRPFRVTVAADEEEVSGVVRFTREGSEPVEIELRPAGGGRLDGEATLGRGSYTLTTILRDRAGNENRAEEDLRVGGSALPSAPWQLWAAACVGLAAALRGRRVRR